MQPITLPSVPGILKLVSTEEPGNTWRLDGLVKWKLHSKVYLA